MRSAVTVLTEHIRSLYLIRRLSLFELKSDNSNQYLGILWEIINPMIQIGIYWFVFGYGIRGRHPVGHTPFILWMLAGMVVWFFVNQATLQASKAIYTRIRMVAQMNFPISVIPTYVIVAKFYQHLMLTAIIFVILQFTPFKASIYLIQLPYYMFGLLALLVSFSLITSTLATVVRDVQMVVQSFVRILLYLTPLLWDPSHLHPTIQYIMRLNPLYYIVEGYRSALLGTSWYLVDHAKYTLYFWVVVLLFFMFGSMVHLKFRAHFVDYM
jgi:teichoic acid transport system permease protein